MKFLITLVIAYAGYKIGQAIKLPVPGLLGSMILVGAYSGLTEKAYTPSILIVVIMGIAGSFIGADIEREDLKELKNILKPLLLLLTLYTINTFVIGYIIYLISDFDLITALFSSVSGSITDISIISLDLGADSAIVALMQTSRVILTLALFPPWIDYLTKDLPKKEAKQTKNMDLSMNMKEQPEQGLAKQNKSLLTLVVALVASYVGSFINFPGSSLIMSTLVITVMNITSDFVYIEAETKTVVQVLAGALLGSTISRELIFSLPDLFFPILIMITSYFLLNFVFSWICAKLGWLDKETAHFASSPAGASDMAIIAADIGADLSDIGTIQIARLIYAVAIMPQLIVTVLSFIN